MTNNVINVGIIGMGTVGTGTLEILTSNKSIITARSTTINVKRICDINVESAKAKAVKYGLSEDIVTNDAYDIINDPDIHIVVELVGGTTIARKFILDALANGKSVVTANKDLVASYGHELFQMAEKHNADFFFEAAVAGGIPIIRPLKECLQANQIDTVMGIVNGTTNFILSEMTETGADFEPTLKIAQDLGYAEADPTSDVEGYDAARKMAILASIAFNSRVTYEDVYSEGITKISKYDIDYAKQLGYVIKLLGVAKCNKDNKIEVRVNPVMIRKHHALASVNDAFNAVFLHGDAVGDVMFYGRGAGDLPTGSAVCSDIIVAAENYVYGKRGIQGCTCFDHKEIKPVEETESKYYVRLMVSDQPRVLGRITTLVGEFGASIDAVMQKRITKSGFAEIVLITHLVKEKDMKQALKTIKTLDCVDKVANYIRVID